MQIHTHSQKLAKRYNFIFESDISRIFSQVENDFRSFSLTGTEQNQNAY